MSRCLIFSNSTFFRLILCAASLLVPPSVAFSAEVAVIKSQDVLPYDQSIQGFRNITRAEVIEYNMKGDVEEGLKIVEQIRRRKPAAVLAVGSKAAVLAKENLSGIPIVYCAVIDPERYGLQAGDVTGIVLEIPVNSQLRAFKSVVPALKRIGVVYDPTKTSGLIRQAQEEARRLGLELVPVEISSAKDLPGALRSLLPKIEGLWMVPDSTVITADSFQFILLETLERHIPFMAFSTNFVKAGALLALSPDYFAIGRQAAVLMDKVVKIGISDQGKVIYPEGGRLIINLKTADILGLKIPEEILGVASEVIQ